MLLLLLLSGCLKMRQNFFMAQRQRGRKREKETKGRKVDVKAEKREQFALATVELC